MLIVAVTASVAGGETFMLARIACGAAMSRIGRAELSDISST